MCLLVLALFGQAFAAPAAHDAPQQRIASVLQRPKVATCKSLRMCKTLVVSRKLLSALAISTTIITCSCAQA